MQAALDDPSTQLLVIGHARPPRWPRARVLALHGDLVAEARSAGLEAYLLPDLDDEVLEHAARSTLIAVARGTVALGLGELWREGARERLSGLDHALITALAAGGVVLHAELIEQGWGRPITERTLHAAMRRLRSRLGPASIATAYGAGYRLVAPVEAPGPRPPPPGPQPPSEPIQLAGATIDLARHAAVGPTGTQCSLTGREQRLLSQLLEAAPQPVPRAALGGRCASDVVARLRQKLGAPVVETVHGQGYRLPLSPSPSAPPPSDPLPTCLPPRPRHTVGRLAPLARAHAALSDRAWITLSGGPGLGKSHLARHLAHARAAGHQAPSDGVWWCAVPASSPSAVRLALASVLGTDTRHLERAVTDCERLIVIDGLDDASPCADLLRRWSSGRSTLLVTARSPCNDQAEHVIELEPLASGDAATLFAALSTAGPIDDERLLAITHGVPLAIELFAADQALSADALVPERVLRALSVERLSGQARRALAELSAFAGSFTPDDASAVVSDGARAQLPELIRRRLLSRTEGRLHLLQPLRTYAEALPGATDARARHARWCLERGERLRDGSPYAPGALQALVPELLAACDHLAPLDVDAAGRCLQIVCRALQGSVGLDAVQDRLGALLAGAPGPRVRLQLARISAHHLRASGHLLRSGEVLEQVLGEVHGCPELRAELRSDAAFCSVVAQAPDAQERLDEAEAACARSPTPVPLARATLARCRAIAAFLDRDDARSATLARDGLLQLERAVLEGQAGLLPGQHDVMFHRATLLEALVHASTARGELVLADHLLQEAEALAERCGNALMRLGFRAAAGSIQSARGQHRRALETFEALAERFQRLGMAHEALLDRCQQLIQWIHLGDPVSAQGVLAGLLEDMDTSDKGALQEETLVLGALLAAWRGDAPEQARLTHRLREVTPAARLEPWLSDIDTVARLATAVRRRAVGTRAALAAASAGLKPTDDVMRSILAHLGDALGGG